MVLSCHMLLPLEEFSFSADVLGQPIFDSQILDSSESTAIKFVCFLVLHQILGYQILHCKRNVFRFAVWVKL